MPRKKIDFDTVRRIALEWPEVEESTAYGSPVLRVRGKPMAGIPVNKSVEPDSLGVWIDFDQRAELLSGAPDVYYVTNHYVSGPIVLVRLSRIQEGALRDLLRAAWRFVTANTPVAMRTVRKPKRGVKRVRA
jgi:hypothetical protein